MTGVLCRVLQVSCSEAPKAHHAAVASERPASSGLSSALARSVEAITSTYKVVGSDTPLSFGAPSAQLRAHKLSTSESDVPKNSGALTAVHFASSSP